MRFSYVASGRFWIAVIASSLIWILARSWFKMVIHDDDTYLLLSKPYVMMPLVAAFFLFLLLGVAWIRDSVRRQYSRSHPSWVAYLLLGFFLSPVIGEMLHAYLSPWHQFCIDVLFWPFSGALLYVTMFFVVGKQKYDFQLEQFAPESAGIDHDRLDYARSAKLAAERLDSLKNPVNVVALYGDMGTGKSSFTRMMVESLDPEKTLYTYISLTETNEASDFSKLFSERWSSTIRNRYPKLLPVDYSAKSLLQEVLRESKNGGRFAHLISFLPSLGILKTRMFVHDKFFKPNDEYVSQAVSSYFEHIGEFEEEKWVFVIDEIERAKLSEIYRTIEVLERLKYLGRRGFPIRLIFILNISRKDLQGRLNGSSSDDPHAVLIKDFLFHNPKNITLSLFVPPLPIEKWIGFIAGDVLSLFREYNFTEHQHQRELLDATNQNMIPDAGKDTMGNKALMEFPVAHHAAYAHLFVRYLLKADPRVIARTIDQARFLINGFIYIDTGKVNSYSIRFADILALAYLQVKHPALVEYFGKTVGYYAGFNRPFESKPPEAGLLNSIMLGQALDHEFANEALQKQQRAGNNLQPTDRFYSDFAAEVSGGDYSKEKVIDLISLSAHFYLDHFSKSGRHDGSEKFLDYYFTTSNPRKLRDLLRSFEEGKDSDDIDVANYLRHQADPEYPKSIASPEELVSYSHFYRNRVSARSSSAHLLLANAIYGFFEEKKIPFMGGDGFSATLLEQATFEFIFNVMESVLISDNDKVIDEATLVLIQALENKSASLEFKLRIVRSFLHERRGDIHFRLKQSFDKIVSNAVRSEKFKHAIKNFIVELRDRYKSDQVSIYGKEEHPIFVLYQSWSGDPDDVKDIDRIRDIAQRGLIDHPNAIEVYWSQYKFDPKWKVIEDAMADLRHRPFDGLVVGTNPNLVIDTNVLAMITEQSQVSEEIKQKARFWENVRTDYQKIVRDNETLMSILLRHPFLI